MRKPLYEHDCEKCVYLGEINKSDAYYCVGGLGYGTTYILRYNSDGPAYASLEDFEDKILYLDMQSHSYSSTFTQEFIERDRRRRVLIQVLRGHIASSM